VATASEIDRPPQSGANERKRRMEEKAREAYRKRRAETAVSTKETDVEDSGTDDSSNDGETTVGDSSPVSEDRLNERGLQQRECEQNSRVALGESHNKRAGDAQKEGIAHKQAGASYRRHLIDIGMVREWSAIESRLSGFVMSTVFKYRKFDDKESICDERGSFWNEWMPKILKTCDIPNDPDDLEYIAYVGKARMRDENDHKISNDQNIICYVLRKFRHRRNSVRGSIQVRFGSKHLFLVYC
jgi:hypothetical protein